MKLIVRDLENNIFIFEATREELDVCIKAIDASLTYIKPDIFDALVWGAGAEKTHLLAQDLVKKLAPLLANNKDIPPLQSIKISITLVEASILFGCFERACSLSLGYADIPTYEQVFGYNREELVEFFERYKKIYFYKTLPMKLIKEDVKEDIFIFEATKEELRVCWQVLHVCLDWLGDEFDARHQDTHESPYETGLEFDKKLEALLEQHKDYAPDDMITVTIRFFEAGIIYDAFNEVCNAIAFGYKKNPTYQQVFGYSREELVEFYDRYKKIYLNKYNP